MMTSDKTYDSEAGRLKVTLKSALGNRVPEKEKVTRTIVGISTTIGYTITLIYAAEDLHQKKRIKEKKIAETESVQEDMVPNYNKVTLESRLDTGVERRAFAKAIEEGYFVADSDHYKWILN